MQELEDLVKLETANSGLAFREHCYGEDDAAMLRDVIALANATVTGPRYLFFGVRDTVGGDRAVVGVSQETWHACKKRLAQVLSGALDPPLKANARSWSFDGKRIGMLCLPACGDPPYLLRKDIAGLAAGTGFVRRGAQAFPLLRADLERLFAAKQPATENVAALRLGFGADARDNEIALPVLGLDALPSAVAAAKTRALLDARASARDVFGRTQTQLSRLVHARVYGADRPYEPQGDTTLREQLAGAAVEHRAADEHYTFELRAHRLELRVANVGASPQRDAVLQLTLPRIDDAGVAEKLYPAPGQAAPDGYPTVSAGVRTIRIESAIGDLSPGEIVAAFRHAPRIWARPGAAGKTLPIDAELNTRDLAAPFRVTVLVRLVAPR